MTTKIIFNGREYASLDDMPADVRGAYEQVMNVFADANRDGTPDIMEGAATAATVNIQFDGEVYSRPEDMPPEARQAYERAMGLLADADHDGTPDMLQGAAKVNVQDVQQVWAPSAPAPETVAPGVSGVSTPQDSAGQWRRLGLIFAALLFIAACAWLGFALFQAINPVR